MLNNKEIDNDLNLLIDDFIERYLRELNNSLTGEDWIEEFDSCNGVEFINKNEKLKNYFYKMRERTNNGEFAENHIPDFYIGTLVEESYLSSCFALSVIYYIQAEYLKKQSDGKSKALMAIASSLNYIGKFSGAKAFEFFAEQHNPSKLNLKENAKKGGSKRDERYMPIRNKIIELIQCDDKPVGGWKSDKEFIKLMKDEIIKFNRDNGRVMVETSILNTVKKWLNNNEMVAPVFLKNSIFGVTPD